MENDYLKDLLIELQNIYEKLQNIYEELKSRKDKRMIKKLIIEIKGWLENEKDNI